MKNKNTKVTQKIACHMRESNVDLVKMNAIHIKIELNKLPEDIAKMIRDECITQKVSVDSLMVKIFQELIETFPVKSEPKKKN